MQENFLSRFKLVAKSRNDYSVTSKITVSKNGLSFNKGMLSKHKDQFYGLYHDPQNNDIVVHFSLVPQSGYRKVLPSSKNPLAYDLFLNAGHGGLLQSPKEFTKLDYINETTILLKSPLIVYGLTKEE